MVELKIEYVSIDSIKPYKNNARHHEDQDVSAIAQSIQEFGFDDPIGVWQDQIVEGHGRLLAAKQLGMNTVPIIRLDHLTDEQRRAYALAHNKTAEMSSWDETLLALELSKINLNMEAFGFELPDMAEPEVSEDDFDVQPPEEPKSKRGDLYILGNHRLLCGDATSPEDVQMLLRGGTCRFASDGSALQRGLPRHRRQHHERQHGRQLVSGIFAGFIAKC